jgi:hypothetical protein
MGNRFLPILMALLMGCPSCGSVKDTHRRRAYVSENPELAESQKDDIRMGNLQAGMTREMVRASLGEPTETSAKTALTGTVEERWYYEEEDETITVEFKDGRVVGWDQKRIEIDR